jgi:hypothetical protein
MPSPSPSLYPTPTVHADSTPPPSAHPAPTTPGPLPHPLLQAPVDVFPLELTTSTVPPESNTPLPESITHTLKSTLPLPESIVQPLETIALPSDSSAQPPESTALLGVPPLVPLPSDLSTKPPESTALPGVPPLAPLPSDLSAQPPESTALPGVSPLVPQSPLRLHAALPEHAVSTRGRRLRKANVLSLNMCTCGVTITDSEINAGTNIMKCRVLGCETVWVRSSFSAVLPCA